MSLAGMVSESKSDFTPSTIFSGASPWIQHSPVNSCVAASCNFGVFTGEDALTYFYSAILEMVLISVSCTMLQTSVHSSSGTLSDLIPLIYLSLPLYNCKGFDFGHT